MTLKIENGDCIELMKNLPDKSIDLFICDLPYGETNCKWDNKINMEEFWAEFKRIRKSKKVACIHFCSTKFGYELIKSWEKGFKMDMVWKKRNKTGGLQSRHRPMRNHEMVYFFYEQAPKYNRDKYHKRIQNAHKFTKDDDCVYGVNKKEKTQGTLNFEPPNPASVVEEEKIICKTKGFGWNGKEGTKICSGNQFEPANPGSVIEETGKYGGKDHTHGNANGGKGYGGAVYARYQKENGIENHYTPLLPTSVIEESEDTIYGEKKRERHERYLKSGTGAHHPPNPASVIEEKPKRKSVKDRKGMIGACLYPKENRTADSFDSPNPASVVEEKYTKEHKENNRQGAGTNNATQIFTKESIKKFQKENGANFDPPNPASVIVEDEPKSMFESTKVFIGKRHHQTEKPQDILEFFLKYWTDEGDTILDPTMGSGSTGVACKTLKRNFIGFELNEKIYNVAKTRLALEK